MKQTKQNASLSGANFQSGGVLLKQFELNRLIAMLLSFIMIFSLFATTVNAAATATVYSTGTTVNITDVTETIDSSLYKSFSSNMKLQLNKSNMEMIVDDSYGIYLSTDYGERDVYYMPSSSTNAYTINDFMDLNFTNAGTIGGRQINVNVHINSLHVGAAQRGESVGDPIGLIVTGSDYLSFGNSVSAGPIYYAEQLWDYTVTITYADTGETVDLPFFQLANDLDLPESASTHGFYRESWEGKNDSFESYYIYDICELTAKQTSDGMLFLGTSNGYNLGIDSPYESGSTTVGGVIGTTYSGEFSGIIYEGPAGMYLSIYSQYMDESVSKTESISSYETYNNSTDITYNVTYTIGEFYVDTFNLYDSMKIYDTLPSEATYVSAKVIDESTNTDITNKGTLSYDSAANKVSFSFSDDYLNNKSNYNGQDITLEITATLSGTATVENTGYVDISGITLTSNTVEAEPLYKITTEVVNGTIDDDVTEIAKGSDETISYTPNDGCVIQSITVDGVSEVIYPHDSSYDFTNITGNHTIKVVYAPATRTITITKKVLKSDINYDNGTPTFVFHLEGTDVNGDMHSYNQIVSMDASLNTDSDGYISESYTFDVIAGTYTSTEILCSRYEFDNIESLTNATSSDSKVTYDVILNAAAKATYINEITNYSEFSHNDSIVNECGWDSSKPR
ncbi:MAG: hypothetical protein LUG21_06190 [Clostridiales bacterium]|nr:hypothetical protein [Clostridiales bacterium]